MHRHRIRSKRSLENAKERCRKASSPLFIVQARYEVVRSEDEARLTSVLKRELLGRINPELTKGLPGFLALYVGMRMLLYSWGASDSA
ncbi:hypothetical protein N9L68_00110 [bacterium]|nr:hypothetical protein [bacterium]